MLFHGIRTICKFTGPRILSYGQIEHSCSLVHADDVTMAFFLRTRRLDLRRLERKPQESLSVVHAILSASVSDINNSLRRIERQFYGPGKTDFDEIKKWSVPIKSVMSSVHMGLISCSWQVDEIIKQLSEPTNRFNVDMFDFNKFKECYRKIRDYVPSKLQDIIIDAKTILKYLEKYCLSFYDPENGIVLETAEHYEKQRRDFNEKIRKCLDHVAVVTEKFFIGKRGLNSEDLTSHGMDIARRTNCTSIGYLLLFPDCCASLREACEAIKAWIATDETYSNFIRNDLKALDKKEEEVLKAVRNLQQSFHQNGFRLKQTEQEYDKLSSDLEKLHDKEIDLMVREEMLKSETNDIQVNIEMKEYRRDDLIKNAMNLHPSVLYERYSEISEALRDLKRRLPYAKREHGAMKHKLDWIIAKKAEKRQLEKKLTQLKKDMVSLEQQKEEHEIEQEQVVKKVELAKQILLYKSCPDSMEKIFNERPVEVNKARLPGVRGNQDPFERTCDVASHHIDNDWPRLYRALPFHPSRGNKTIDKDIQEITSKMSRMSVDELAKKSLHRWRRFHTRAKLEDVKEALCAIKRYDIVNKIDAELNPVGDQEPEEEEKITYVEEYLIPFVKQVEKFDQLRAANIL